MILYAANTFIAEWINFMIISSKNYHLVWVEKMFYDVSSQKVTRGGHTRALDVDVTDILDVLRRLIPKGYKGGHTDAYDYMNKIIERFHIDIAVYKSSSSDAIQKKKKLQKYDHLSRNGIFRFLWMNQTSVYKGYKQDKIEMRGDRAEMSDFPLYLNTVAGGLDRRDQTIGGFSFVVKIYAVPVVEIIG